MKYWSFYPTDVDGAREEILSLVQKNTNSKIIYFDGWKVGYATTAVLRSIAQVVPSMISPPPKLCFGKIIYLDCTRWKSERLMQRRIAAELKLDHQTMAKFDEQDEEDDFSGVDPSSRGVIRDVAAVIDQTLRESRFMMIFLNGGDDEVVLSRFGIPEYHDCVIIWAFTRRFLTMKSHRSIRWTQEKLIYTDLFISSYTEAGNLSISDFSTLFRQEAASIVSRYPNIWGVDMKIVIDCCLYGLLMYLSFHSTNGFVWLAHSPNYWICDGIIQGDRSWEISNTLNSEVSFDCDDYMLDRVYKNLKEDPKTPFLIIKDNDNTFENRPYRWISIILKNKKVHKKMQTILAKASSIFLTFEAKGGPGGLPYDLFKLCNNLVVLTLSLCAFSFDLPPFHHCRTLRFLGLDHCTDDSTVDLQGVGRMSKWAFLQSLWVADLHYTDWVEILSEENIDLMSNLLELNMEGVRFSHLTSQLVHKRLPYLQRLRIIKPLYEIQTSSIDISDSFMEKTNLEILDFSGNIYMKELPTSISKASHLQVLILDGCDGLENIVVPNRLPPSLRSFSFDGYGPASHRTSTAELPPKGHRPERLPAAEKKDVKVSMISLEGCTQLHNLFLRGLPNLVELDLSGCAIKVLDFETMVVDAPSLKRLFLLGCEHLRTIRWGTYNYEKRLVLEVLCIDTRPARALGCVRPSLHESLQLLQVHVVTADARIARSLYDLICDYAQSYCYNIHFTSSTTACGGVVQTAQITTSKSNGQQHCLVTGIYGDVFSKVNCIPIPMLNFPQPPTQQLDCHIDIDDGSHNVQSEAEDDSEQTGYGLGSLMTEYTKSIYVHDVSACSNTMSAGRWRSLRWCRVERCPNLDAVFPPNADEFGQLETIWVSDLVMARYIWGTGLKLSYYMNSLRHLHLRSCPSLHFALPVARPSFPSLETLHIIHCDDLKRVFIQQKKNHAFMKDKKYQTTSLQFPKLSTIHLHDLPALQEICDHPEMLAPSLETIKIRGCWSLRRLPALRGREPGMRRPNVEVEKEVWEALEWDGVDAGHHPSLYQAPVHSRYYKRSSLLRGTVLR